MSLFEIAQMKYAWVETFHTWIGMGGVQKVVYTRYISILTSFELYFESVHLFSYFFGGKRKLDRV